MDDGLNIIKAGTTITTGGTSTSATLPTPTGNVAAYWVRIAATAAAYVKIGIGSATATTSDILVQPADAVILRIPSGYDKIAAIQDSAAGKVNVTPIEQA